MFLYTNKQKFGMRSTSDHAKYVHDLFEFQNQFMTANSISKRSLPVGFTINCKICYSILLFQFRRDCKFTKLNHVS